MSDNEVSTRVIVGPATISYPHIDQPTLSRKPKPGEKAKYSGAFVFAPGTDLTRLKAAIVEAARKKFGDTITLPNGTKIAIEKALLSGGFKYPLHTDAEMKGYPEGSTYFNARSERKPGAVYAHAEPGTNKPAPIPEDKIRDELYPGAIVNVSVTAFGFDNESKGVGLALNNVQKIGDGERLDSQRKAEDEFTADLSQAPADLAALV